MARGRTRPGGVVLLVLAVALVGTVGVPADAVEEPTRSAPSVTAAAAPPPPTLEARTRNSAAVPAAVPWQERQIVVDGVQRSYWLQLPAGRGTVPLVVALHGLKDSAAGFATWAGLPAAADAAGVALVVPQGLDRSWNDGRFGATGVDDQEFLLALIAEIDAGGRVDGGRVTIGGFSNGAEMTMVMVSEHPEVFAGAVTVAGELLAGPGQSRPSEPVPVWIVHGDADRVAPWAGRPTANPPYPALESMDDTTAAFRAANRTVGGPVTLSSNPGPVVRSSWAAGPGGAPVTQFRITGGGHVWPRAADGLDATALLFQVGRSR